MKKFLKILFIFLAMMVSLIIEPSDLQAKSYQPDAYIQSLTKESVEIVSNNFYGGEIYSYQEENNQNISGNSPHIISFSSDKDFKLKNKTHSNEYFIHNLSTNLKNVQNIRAP